MITVGLPVYKQIKILSVALTGLANQEKPGEWELMVCSENNVESIVNGFRKRLLNAGCCNINIDKLDTWIPLPQKWRKMGRMMHSESIGMILQAADCYPHPKRIAQSRDAMSKGYDWYHEQRGYFYDIPSKRMVLFDGGERESKTFLNMCIASRHARNLPLSDKKKSIDGWMFKTIDSPKVFTYRGMPKGVDFNGANTISLGRGKRMRELRYPFTKTKIGIKEVLTNWYEIKRCLS